MERPVAEQLGHRFIGPEAQAALREPTPRFVTATPPSGPHHARSGPDETPCARRRRPMMSGKETQTGCGEVRRQGLCEREPSFHEFVRVMRAPSFPGVRIWMTCEEAQPACPTALLALRKELPKIAAGEDVD
jgi:hypothetical protein